MREREEIRILSITPVMDRGALKAFAQIQVGDFTFTDCRIINENGKKPWVSMPVLSYKNEHGMTRYRTLVQVLDKNLKNEISQAILRAWGSNYGGVNGNRRDSQIIS